MYCYNLIINIADIPNRGDHNEAVYALVNQQLTRRFGPDVFYHEHAILNDEAVIIVSHDSKRTLQTVLGEWFNEANRDEPGKYPLGTLLHYREILRDEPTHIVNKSMGWVNG